MEAIKTVIETLKEKYHFQQPVLEPIPNLPDYIDPDNTFVVIKKGPAYQIEDLSSKKSYTVSKVSGVVYCSCEKGQEKSHCSHKRAVLREYKKIKRLRADESVKRRIGASLSAYLHRIQQIVREFERNKDTQNSSYWYYKGRLQTYKHVIRIIIES